MTDAKLLQEYAAGGSEAAFSELVGRHADWVYSAALRMVRDPHLADDVTQAVFLLLAQKATKISSSVSVSGWLFHVARHSAAHALRAKARREKHERQAAEMAQTQAQQEDEVWAELSPRLEELVARLRPAEREAVLLRFYQKKTMAEVGAALGVSEDTAKKRVAAAVEKLRKGMNGPGGTMSAVAWAAVLAARTTHASPVGLVAACAKAHVLAAAPAAGIAQGVIKMMMLTKIKIVAVATLAVGVCVGGGVALIDIRQHFNESAAQVQSAPPAAAPDTGPAVVDASDKLDPKEKANRIQCAGNLHAIGTEVINYANANAGDYPASLGTLAAVIDDPGKFICPGSGTRPPADWKSMTDALKTQWVNVHSDYTYLIGGMNQKQIDKLTQAQDMIVAYESDKDHTDGMNVLFVDSHVEWESLADAHALIDQTKRAINAVTRPTDAATERKNRVQCASNMRLIDMWALTYVNDNQGNYPADLGTLLISGQTKDPTVFLCPDSGTQFPQDWYSKTQEQQGAWITAHSDYTYLGGQMMLEKYKWMKESFGSIVLLYESDHNHVDGMNVAFLDGHVECMTPERAHQAIEKTKADLAALH